jgi:SAM-dependent methyltransferase
MPDDIYNDGRHYDRMFPDAGPVIEFLAARARDPLLELACGTGRVSIPLAQAGFSVTGIDISAGMLKIARQKSSAVEWIHGDVRDFHLDRQFSTVVFVFNALCHLLTLDDFERCMRCVRQHLAPDGRLMIEVFVPEFRILTRHPDSLFLFSEYDDPDGSGRMIVMSSNRYEPDTQINRVTTFHRFPNGPEVEGSLTMRMYFPQELDALLKYNGFTIEHKYGDYDGRPFDSKAEQQIVICKLSEGCA